MARPRHCLTSIGAALLLSCCSQSPAPPPPVEPVRANTAAAAPAPAPAPVVVPVAPEWQSRVPDITPAEIDATLRLARGARDRGQLERGQGPGPGALELYLAVLDVDPANAQAQTGVQSVLDALLERGHIALRAGAITDARRIEVIASTLLPLHPDLGAFQQKLRAAEETVKLLDKADAAARAGRISTPSADSALDFYRRAQNTFEDFSPTRARMEAFNRQLLEQAWKQARADDFAAAEALLMQSSRLLPGNAPARVAELRIIELRQSRTARLLAQGNAAVDKLSLDSADKWLRRAEAIAAQRTGVDALRERIHLARHYGPFKPGQLFSEPLGGGSAKGPEMVVVPYGKFQMGSTPADPGHLPGEAPRHEVEFKRGFAIARNEVTVGDFRRFARATGYRSLATRAGSSMVYDERGGVLGSHAGVDWRRDHVGRIASASLPVVHIAFQDAQAYVRWLSKSTGQSYRLPSEAEFEYVLRAGSSTIYPWGNTPPRRVVGNLPGDGDLSRLGRRWGNAIPGYRDAFWGPAPVRNFPAEGFNTFDMIGNVSEWTLDCWHDSYQRAPMDGTAWVNPGCAQRVMRGASWGSSLEHARSASRLPMQAETSTARLGFRVVREL